MQYAGFYIVGERRSQNFVNDTVPQIAILDRENQFDAAQEMYIRALERNPKHISNLANYALFLASRGKRKDAVQACQRAIKLAADGSPEYEQLTEILGKIRA